MRAINNTGFCLSIGALALVGLGMLMLHDRNLIVWAIVPTITAYGFHRRLCK